MLSNSHLGITYGIAGIVSCAVVSVAAIRLGWIDKNSEFLYLSLGFYRHFCRLYGQNFLRSLKMIIYLALGRNPVRPLVYSLPFEYKNKFNPTLFAVTLNLSAGLFCIGIRDQNFLVHALDEKYFEKIDLYKLGKILPEVNDDNLV